MDGQTRRESLRDKTRLNYKDMQEGRVTTPRAMLAGKIKQDPAVARPLSPLGASKDTLQQQQTVSGLAAHPEMVDEEKLQAMKREMLELREEEGRLRMRVEMESMEKELAAQRRRVQKLRGKHYASSISEDTSHNNKTEVKSDIDGVVCMDDLRRDGLLQELVQKELKKLGLKTFLEPEMSNSSSESSDSSEES